jgi:hypothetical protein
MKTVLRTTACLSVVLFGASCAQVLDLDGYTEVPPETASGGTGGGGASGTGGGAATGGTGGVGGMGGMGGAPICTPSTSDTCYSGLPGTENVGNCKEGTKTCSTDGFSWSSCEGEVVPAPNEDCDVTGDENCDGKVCADAIWSGVYGDANLQYSNRVAVDTMGNVYIVGTFEGGLDFNGASVVSSGAYDVFVAKFDPTGKALWAKKYGTGSATATEAGQVIAVDATGNVVFGGYAESSLDFGKGAVTAGLFLVKLDANGNCLWSKGFGAIPSNPPLSGVSNATGVAFNSKGEIFFTGYIGNTANFGDGSVTPASTDMVIVKYSSGGTIAWKKHFNAASTQQAKGIAIDASDNIIVTGQFAGTVDFGGQMRSATDLDAFVVRYDPSGTLSWVKAFSATSIQEPMSAAVDSSGGIIITGTTRDTVNFGGGNVGTTGKTEGFYAKFDATGAHQWSASFTADQYQHVGVSTGPGKEVVLIGSYSGSTTIGGKTLTALGSLDIFLAKLGDMGQLLWVKSIGDANLQMTGDVAVHPASGDIVITGTTMGMVDFGTGPLAANGRDVYLAKFYP